ncbi:MAG: hypothetical protein GX557_06410 [Chloroflexi bacterium]|nr:hypothetical protein [Chloroflexota bacterium]
MTLRARCALWWRWVLANALSETLGLGSTFAIGFGLFAGLPEPSAAPVAIGQALLMTASGLLEGAIVGLAQWRVLRAPFPRLTRRTWVAATILGALLAWACGSVPMTLASLSAGPEQATATEPAGWVIALAAAGMGAVAGLVLALFQWRALRAHVRGAALWLPAHALAWALGMPLIFAAVDLAQTAGSLAGALALMAAAIALVGALVGAIHGLALVKLAAPEDCSTRV